MQSVGRERAGRSLQRTECRNVRARLRGIKDRQVGRAGRWISSRGLWSLDQAEEASSLGLGEAKGQDEPKAD